MTNKFSCKELNELFEKTTKEELFKLAFTYAHTITNSQKPVIIAGEMEKDLEGLKLLEKNL